MSELFSYSKAWLLNHHALHTAQEIEQQPCLWKELHDMLVQTKIYWQPFLQPLLTNLQLQIVLCGAGSSAFAGRALAPWLREHCHLDVVACGTTDIVPSPLQYLDPRRPTLLISYGRSGDSPESIATVRLADQLLPQCYHLMLTCNPKGQLAQYAKGRGNVCSLVMPQGSHDQGFAMTSSFSCMTLATLLLLGPQTLEQTHAPLQQMVTLCERESLGWRVHTKKLARAGFKRAVLLGNRCFTGLAEEGALKLLELTAGKIATRYDTPMGFRHGPKFMADRDTMVLLMMSSDSYCRRYEQDLLDELRGDGLAHVVALSSISGESLTVLNSDLDDIWLLFPYLLFIQMLALETSLSLGITPDNPCPTGEVNRVVKGVDIYPFTPATSQKSPGKIFTQE